MPGDAERNRATVVRFYEALSQHDLGAMRACLADTYVYWPSPDEAEAVRGPDAFLTFEQTAFEAFPDLHAEVLATVAEHDLVATRLRVTGTHEGEFLGIPASGNRLQLEYANLSRFDEDGRIVEDRDYVDNLALMQQLGVDGEEIGG